jgi:hypothetical protein
MKFVLHPWQLLPLILPGWINHQERGVIEYLQAENRVLREKLGKKRILLDDDQRRRLAVKGKMLEQMATIVTPDTILRWHRELEAAKWDYGGRHKKIGRPSNLTLRDQGVILRRVRTPESTVCPRREMALKYIWSPLISAAMNARSVSNPLAVMPDFRSMLPTRNRPPEPTTKYAIPFCGLTRS